jgi:uncharacterized protein
MKKGFPTVRGPLPAGVRLEENVHVAMRDGVKIAVDVYRPLVEGRFPALFSMSPYIKEIQLQPPELSHDIEAGDTGFYVPRGYVHVIAQIRGTGLSQGQYRFLDTKEQQDGYDLVEWIARQPWCDGNVGMIGDSYFAMIQYLVAAQQPPHLKCIVPYDGATDPYRDICYQGGIYNKWFTGNWGPEVIRQALWPGRIKGKRPPADLIVDWASHPEDGEYYWERAAWTRLEKIKVPVLSIVPHSIIHSRGQLYAYQRINVPRKLLILPPGAVDAHVHFRCNGPLNQQMLRWYDYWLKGVDNGIMSEPPVAIFDSATLEWRYENEYPLARTRWTKFFMRTNPLGQAARPPYGLISVEPPGDEEPDTYSTPECFASLAGGKPVLAYCTPPLDRDLRAWGPLSAVLYGSSTTLDTAWFVKIGDVGEDGRVSLITEGLLKASFRQVDEAMSQPGMPFHPFQHPVRPEPNEVYEYRIEIRPIFHTFKSKHRIRLQIASIDSGYQGTINTLYASEMLPVPATNSIYHDRLHASHLLLPVVPDAEPIRPVEMPVSQIKWKPEFRVL